MSIVRLTLLCALLGFLPVGASSQPAPSQAEWFKDLRMGGYVIVFRHGATNSDQANERLDAAPAQRSGARPGKIDRRVDAQAENSCGTGPGQHDPAGNRHRDAVGLWRGY